MGYEDTMRQQQHGHDLLVAHQDQLCAVHAEDIVEIGSERRGGSTHALMLLAKACGFGFVTCDINEERAQRAIREFPTARWVCRDGSLFLASLKDNTLAAVYLDAFDIVSGSTVRRFGAEYASFGLAFTQENCELMHLCCAEALIDKVVTGGLVCIDDTGEKDEKWCGKGATAVPYLLDHGFVMIDRWGSTGGAVLLEKK